MLTTSSIFKSIIHYLMIASIFLSSSSGWLKVQAIYAAKDENQTLHFFEIPRELMIELSVSEKGSTFYIQLQGQLIKAVYNGMLDSNSFKECFNLSKTCIPNADLSPSDEKLNIQEGEYQIIDNKTHQSHAGSFVKDSDSAAPSNGTGFSSHLIGAVSNIGNRALQAGITAGIVSILGGKELKQIGVSLNQSNHNLLQFQDQYIETIKQTQFVGRSYQQAIKSAEFLKTQKINIGISQRSSLIDLNQLSIASAPFDEGYKARVNTVATQLNSLPPFVDSYGEQFKSLSTDLLFSSIDNRLKADYDLSDAQLNVAQDIADFLVGIDPYSGLLRGVYEAYTGENMVTGQPLDDFQRTLSGAMGALNLVTLGLASSTYVGYKVVTQIYKNKFAANYSAYLSKAKSTLDLVELFKVKKILRPKDLKKLDGLLRKGVSQQAILNVEDVSKAIDKAAQTKLIAPLKFSSKFNDQPFNDQSLEFIFNGIEVGHVKAQRIFPGNTDEIYIIGRKMGDPDRGINGVIQYKEALINAGYNADKIKIFHSKEIDQLSKELTKEAQSIKRRFSLEELRTKEIWRLNEEFIDAAIGVGQKKPTIIDLQRTSNEPFSHFYDTLEIGRLNESGRKLWNPRQQ